MAVLFVNHLTFAGADVGHVKMGHWLFMAWLDCSYLIWPALVQVWVKGTTNDMVT